MVSGLEAWITKRDAQLRDAMQAELEAAIIEGKTYHENAVRTWVNKPKWIVRADRSSNQLRALLEVAGENRDIWQWVDKGTGQYGNSGSPYWIFPRRPGGRLLFQAGYDPKTRPVAKANVGSGTSSGPTVSSTGVLHPGIKAREFSKTYREKILFPSLKPRIVKRVRRT